MAERERPYDQFNFVVSLGDGSATDQAGFDEISGLGAEVSVSGYRNTNSDVGNRAPSTMRNATVITLKRGLIDAAAMSQWLQPNQDGAPATRTVTIRLQNDARNAALQTWKLVRARIAKHSSFPLSPKDPTSLAIEELVLQGDRLELTERRRGVNPRGADNNALSQVLRIGRTGSRRHRRGSPASLVQ